MDWRPRTQRKAGQFKAFDALGHVYYVEVYTEPRKTENIRQQHRCR